MSAVRSFIVRVYRRRGGRELSGTLEAVERPHAGSRPLPQAFANDEELISLMRAGAPAAPPPSPNATEAPAAPASRRGSAGRGRGAARTK